MGRPLGSRYTIEQLLGRGGMGEVYRCLDDTGAEYAAKVLRRELATDQGVVTRFVQERSVLLGVSDPHLVQVHDLVIEGETLAIVMDLVRGPDLRQGLRDVGTCPPFEVARLCAELTGALAAVHAAGVVHRDIKPENVLLDLSTRPPAVRLSDFGISRLFDGAEHARATVLMGTPLYMAPELISGVPATPASDLYSVGVLAYELCCGVTPFAGPTMSAVLHNHATFAPGRPDGIPDPLWQLIEELVAKAPTDRPPSAAAVAARFGELAAALVDLPAAPLLSTPPPGRAVTHPVNYTMDQLASAAAMRPGAGTLPTQGAPRHLAKGPALAALAVAVVAAALLGGAALRHSPGHPDTTGRLVATDTNNPAAANGDPIGFVTHFYRLLPAEVDVTWQLLTERQQQQVGGLEAWKNAWANVSGITVENPEQIDASTVRATLRYQRGDGATAADASILHLVAQPSGGWLLDAIDHPNASPTPSPDVASQ
jgi:serine/threonine-protein kinase